MASQPNDVFPAHPNVANRHQGRTAVDRPCPGDFDEMFISLGRSPDGCEAHYQARRETVTRWLMERGKERLIEARAAYVADLRARGEWITRGTNMTSLRTINPVSIRASIRDGRRVDDSVAREAAHFLRTKRNAGLIVSRADEPATWWVGSRRMRAFELVDLAKLKGFDQFGAG